MNQKASASGRTETRKKGIWVALALVVVLFVIYLVATTLMVRSRHRFAAFDQPSNNSLFVPNGNVDDLHYALFDVNGKQLSDYVYSDVHEFVGGYALVSDANGKYAVLNELGQTGIAFGEFVELSGGLELGGLYLGRRANSDHCEVVNARGQNVFSIRSHNEGACEVSAISSAGIPFAIIGNGNSYDLYTIEGNKLASFNSASEPVLVQSYDDSHLAFVGYEGGFIALDDAKHEIISKKRTKASYTTFFTYEYEENRNELKRDDVVDTHRVVVLGNDEGHTALYLVNNGALLEVEENCNFNQELVTTTRHLFACANSENEEALVLSYYTLSEKRGIKKVEAGTAGYSYASFENYAYVDEQGAHIHRADQDSEINLQNSHSENESVEYTIDDYNSTYYVIRKTTTRERINASIDYEYYVYDANSGEAVYTYRIENASIASTSVANLAENHTLMIAVGDDDYSDFPSIVVDFTSEGGKTLDGLQVVATGEEYFAARSRSDDILRIYDRDLNPIFDVAKMNESDNFYVDNFTSAHGDHLVRIFNSNNEGELRQAIYNLNSKKLVLQDASDVQVADTYVIASFGDEVRYYSLGGVQIATHPAFELEQPDLEE